MFIASVELELKNKERFKYKIVTEESEENYDSEIALIYYKSYLADKIIEAYTKGKDSFSLDEGRQFKIISIITNSLFESFNVHKRRRVNFVNKSIPIHLYSKMAICPACRRNGRENRLENVIATVSCILNRSDTCEIEIQYCHYCKKYFIDEQSLVGYERKYGLLLFERIDSTDEDYYGDLYYNKDTILSRYGYSAQNSDESRRTVLIYLIENGYKNEVKSILSSFIRYRGDRCYKACPVWISDLSFVNNYGSEDDRYVGYGIISRK